MIVQVLDEIVIAGELQETSRRVAYQSVSDFLQFFANIFDSSYLDKNNRRNRDGRSGKCRNESIGFNLNPGG